ncbi:protein YIPF1 [Nematostella vectensis]|uniref:protein YIPF1 n=1 Tax=Nematostella vectensis TaxID=45351 RepID=UPI001390692A|nr:protein YIPF1 [Nematostella vectensis]
MADESEKQGLIDIPVDDDDDDVIDDLIFQDFHKETVPQSTTTTSGTIGNAVPIESSFPPPPKAADDSDDDGDKVELLGSERKAPPFWTFEYYQAFFDVDTYQVGHRILGSMVPAYKRNFLISHIRPNPDLYGPFWVCATLVFTTAIAGNLASYLVHTGDHEWVYDFHKVTLAAAAIYAYAFLVPTGLWGLLLWRKSNAGYSFLEILCVYGYSLSIYIPISFLWVIPVEWLRWIFVLIGMVLSGSVLLLTFWPAVEDDDKKVSLVIMLLIFLLHGLLAIGFKLYFFHGPPESPITTTTSTFVTTIATTLSSTLATTPRPK